MHAYCLEYLISNLGPGAKVLDVGCGSGYMCAALYELVKDEHHLNRTAVVGIEHVDPLAEMAMGNLKKSYLEETKSGQIQIVCGDGRKGYAAEAPYDVIHVGAAAPSLPRPLIE